MSIMQDDLIRELGAYGASSNEVLLLDTETPFLIDYLDLLAARNPSHLTDRKPGLCPDAVLEFEGRPGLYVLRADHLVGEISTQREQLLQVRRAIACRGDTAPLAVIQHGQITIFASELKTELPSPLTIRREDSEARWLIRDILMGVELASGKEVDLFGNAIKGHSDSEAIYDLLFRLLTEVNSSLLRTTALSGKLDDVLSLVGRALFTRFLIDRGIINRKTFPAAYTDGGPEGCFADAKAAAKTCMWLEENFNGELLPLPAKKSELLRYFRSLDSTDHSVFKGLSKILYRTTESGQLHLDWGFVDFAHVPVGLLSQVYERYAHEHFEKNAKDESVHYTPHHIANYVVKQAFEGITTAKRDKIRMLDPAAGAGIFLVLGFRRLIAERWAVTKQRPDKNEIRKILYEQIRGFDINEHALKLAALSLYLTALELDPDPFPPSALKFEKLQGLVLIPTRQKGEEFPAYPVLGSLGPAIGEEHNNQYDLVIANPPWTAWDGKGSETINAAVQKMIRRIACSRDDGLLEEVANGYQHPDKVPDLPFVWKAMEWAKKDGVLAFVLHGRLLFKRTDIGAKARNALFRAVRVTGILNGAGLDATTVWPGINQPFCLFFAKNRPAASLDTFYFVSPDRERQLNSKNIIRVDYQSAQPIEWSVLEQQPHLLKTLFRGTALDAELIHRLQSMTVPRDDGMLSTCVRLADYWIPTNDLWCGFGYQVAGRGNDARELQRLRGVKLDNERDLSLLIDTKRLPKFDENKLHRQRDPNIYLPPLVIIKKAPGQGRGIERARLSLDTTPVIYKESFIGYSAHHHPEGEALASYLFLLINSDLYLYYTLLTSSQFGVERRVMHAEDVADFPIVRFELLTQPQKSAARKLALAFSSGQKSMPEVNDWVYQIYNLEPSDRDVIRDTLATQMPFQAAVEKADSIPSENDIDTYIAQLKNVLMPFFEDTGETIEVRRSAASPDAWIFLDIVVAGNDNNDVSTKLDVAGIVRLLADNAGSSRVFVEHGVGHLSVGIIARYRYWTKTRARLCAIDILRDHGHVFPIEEHD